MTNVTVLYRVLNTVWTYLLASGIACFMYAGSLGEKSSYYLGSVEDKWAKIHQFENLGITALGIAGLFLALAIVVGVTRGQMAKHYREQEYEKAQVC